MLTREAILLSQHSTVHLLYRGKGQTGAWSGLCTASKISSTELISAEHCFAEAITNTLPADEFRASNYVGTASQEYAVANPERITQPMLRISGISLARLSDLALLTVSPNRAPATADGRRVWRQVTVLPYPLADGPPKQSTVAVVTSYPLGSDGRFHKVTYLGSFISRKSSGAGTPLQDTIRLTTTPTGACKPGASGSRLIFANGTTSGALTSAANGICYFSVLTDRTLSGLQAGLHHPAIRHPFGVPVLEPLPDPTLTATSFDGLTFRIHFGGDPGRFNHNYFSCPAGTIGFVGGTGSTYSIEQITPSTAGWTAGNDPSDYYGDAYLQNGTVVGLGMIVEVKSDADGSGEFEADIGCPLRPLRTIPTRGEFDNASVDSTVSGGFPLCASYAYTRPHAYEMYVTVTVHACQPVLPPP